MAKYNVEIVETLSKVIEVKGSNYEDAQYKAETMYNNGEVELNYDDKMDTNYYPYPSQKLKNSFKININYDCDNVIISSENSARESHSCRNKEDLLNSIKSYIDNNIELQKVNPIQRKDLDR